MRRSGTVCRSYKKSGFGADFSSEMAAQIPYECPKQPAFQQEIPSAHTVDDVMLKLEKALAKLGKAKRDAPLSAICETDLNAVSDAILRAGVVLRREFARRAGPAVGYVFSGRPAQIPADVCHVERPEHALLKVTLPVILPGEKGEWYSAKKLKTTPSALFVRRELGNLVMDALLADIYENGAFEASIGRCFLIFRRHVLSKPDDMRTVYVDNNNIETGEVTNAICKAVGIGDDYRNMCFVYLSVPDGTEQIVEVILCEEKEFAYWMPCRKE